MASRQYRFFFFFQAEDGIRDDLVTGVQTCALPILISLRGTRTRIVYGRLITTCPITTVRTERGTPSVWKSRSSEIPKTTKGITSGLRRSDVTSALARKRLRATAIDASVPSRTAPTLESAATI